MAMTWLFPDLKKTVNVDGSNDGSNLFRLNMISGHGKYKIQKPLVYCSPCCAKITINSITVAPKTWTCWSRHNL